LAESTEIVRVDGVPGVMLVGTKVGVRPAGAVAVRATELVNPFRGLMVIVDALELLAEIVREVGFVETVKSGAGGGTVTVIVTFWLRDTLVPVTFTR
jgi:hypothetical protein